MPQSNLNNNQDIVLAMPFICTYIATWDCELDYMSQCVSTWLRFCVVLCCVAFSCSALRKMNEKRQLFNMYKTQKKKEEAEEEQERVRKNREDIFDFLEDHEMVHAETRFS